MSIDFTHDRYTGSSWISEQISSEREIYKLLNMENPLERTFSNVSYQKKGFAGDPVLKGSNSAMKNNQASHNKTSSRKIMVKSSIKRNRRSVIRHNFPGKRDPRLDKSLPPLPPAFKRGSIVGRRRESVLIDHPSPAASPGKASRKNSKRRKKKTQTMASTSPLINLNQMSPNLYMFSNMTDFETFAKNFNQPGFHQHLGDSIHDYDPRASTFNFDIDVHARASLNTKPHPRLPVPDTPSTSEYSYSSINTSETYSGSSKPYKPIISSQVESNYPTNYYKLSTNPSSPSSVSPKKTRNKSLRKKRKRRVVRQYPGTSLNQYLYSTKPLRLASAAAKTRDSIGCNLKNSNKNITRGRNKGPDVNTTSSNAKEQLESVLTSLGFFPPTHTLVLNTSSKMAATPESPVTPTTLLKLQKCLPLPPLPLTDSDVPVPPRSAFRLSTLSLPSHANSMGGVFPAEDNGTVDAGASAFDGASKHSMAQASEQGNNDPIINTSLSSNSTMPCPSQSDGHCHESLHQYNTISQVSPYFSGSERTGDYPLKTAIISHNRTILPTVPSYTVPSYTVVAHTIPTQDSTPISTPTKRISDCNQRPTTSSPPAIPLKNASRNLVSFDRPSVLHSPEYSNSLLPTTINSSNSITYNQSSNHFLRTSLSFDSLRPQSSSEPSPFHHTASTNSKYSFNSSFTGPNPFNIMSNPNISSTQSQPLQRQQPEGSGLDLSSIDNVVKSFISEDLSILDSPLSFDSSFDMHLYSPKLSTTSTNTSSAGGTGFLPSSWTKSVTLNKSWSKRSMISRNHSQNTGHRVSSATSFTSEAPSSSLATVSVKAAASPNVRSRLNSISSSIYDNKGLSPASSLLPEKDSFLVKPELSSSTSDLFGPHSKLLDFDTILDKENSAATELAPAESVAPVEIAAPVESAASSLVTPTSPKSNWPPNILHKKASMTSKLKFFGRRKVSHSQLKESTTVQM